MAALLTSLSLWGRTMTPEQLYPAKEANRQYLRSRIVDLCNWVKAVLLILVGIALLPAFVIGIACLFSVIVVPIFWVMTDSGPAINPIVGGTIFIYDLAAALTVFYCLRFKKSDAFVFISILVFGVIGSILLWLIIG
jgi:hypothetical protein